MDLKAAITFSTSHDYPLRGLDDAVPGDDAPIGAADPSQWAAGHLRPLPGRPQGVAADGSDRPRRRRRWPRASRVRRHGVRGDARGTAHVRPDPRTVSGGRAVAGTEPGDAARSAMALGDRGRRLAGLAIRSLIS